MGMRSEMGIGRRKGSSEEYLKWRKDRFAEQRVQPSSRPGLLLRGQRKLIRDATHNHVSELQFSHLLHGGNGTEPLRSYKMRYLKHLPCCLEYNRSSKMSVNNSTMFKSQVQS